MHPAVPTPPGRGASRGSRHRRRRVRHTGNAGPELRRSVDSRVQRALTAGGIRLRTGGYRTRQGRRAVGTATWSLVPAAVAPSPRDLATWTVDADGRYAYLFAGRNGAQVLFDLWQFDLQSGAWTLLSPKGNPKPRYGQAAAWVPGTGLVIFGGQSSGGQFFNDIWAYAPDANTWTELPSKGEVPKARYGTCAGLAPDGTLLDQPRFLGSRTPAGHRRVRLQREGVEERDDAARSAAADAARLRVVDRRAVPPVRRSGRRRRGARRSLVSAGGGSLGAAARSATARTEPGRDDDARQRSVGLRRCRRQPPAARRSMDARHGLDGLAAGPAEAARRRRRASPHRSSPTPPVIDCCCSAARTRHWISAISGA